jgi:hypothetical protein
MAKAKAVQAVSKAPEVKQIVLTQEQFDLLIEIKVLVDTASDVLNDIDGEENLFTIGRQVGEVYSDLSIAFNHLDKIIEEVDPENDELEGWSFESED